MTVHSPSMEPGAAIFADRRRPRTAKVVTLAVTAARPGDMAAFREPSALAAGQVLLLSLDAVAEHLAAEWQGRRVEIYDRTTRVLSRRLSAAGSFARTAETDYILVQPDLDGRAGEDAAMEVLREVVASFVAEPMADHLKLFRVDRLSDGHVVCEALDAAAILARAHARTLREDAHDGWDILSAERWAPFIAGDGRQVRPSCTLEPVFEISSQHRIGYRLRRRLLDLATGEPLSLSQQRNLARADILRIDTATLARGIERLNSAADHEAELSLILPVSYLSLTHPEGRDRLSGMFARARASVKAGVICEIYDIEDISEAALAAAVAVVRPWSLFVVGYLADDKPRASAAMKAAGVQVLSFTVPPNIESDAEFIGWLRTGIRSAHRVGRSVMVYGCHTQRRLALAGLLGATHASLTA